MVNTAMEVLSIVSSGVLMSNNMGYGCYMLLPPRVMHLKYVCVTKRPLSHT
jgi:hypothetical protein